MRLTTAMLADAARVENGKLYVHGGAWDQISASNFPMTHPTLALALVFEFAPYEANTDIDLSYELIDEDGHRRGPQGSGVMRVGIPSAAEAGDPIVYPYAITFPLLQFPSPGAYRFRVLSGDQELAELPLRVRHVG